MLPHDELLHFGVRGMRWGIRRGSSSSPKSSKRTKEEEELRLQKKEQRTQKKKAQRERKYNRKQIKLQKQQVRIQKAMKKQLKEMGKSPARRAFDNSVRKAGKTLLNISLSAAVVTAGLSVLILSEDENLDGRFDDI